MSCSQLMSFIARRSVHCKRRTCLSAARLLANRTQSQESAAFCTSHVSSSAEAPLAAPYIEGTEKIYTPKIHKLVDEISTLTLLEVADLNELLKKTLNIQEAPMMAMGPVASVKEEEPSEAVAQKEEQTLFTVKLIKFDAAKKVALIKEIKSQIAGLNLVQAKKFVEAAPQPVKTDISKEEAETLKTTLEAVGAEVLVE